MSDPPPPPPPPPPPEEQARMTRDELVEALTWPLDDWKAVHRAAEQKGIEMGPPVGIYAGSPVDVRMFAEREVDRAEFPG